MYRSVSVMLLILLSTSAFSTDARVERWNQRLEKLKKIRTENSSTQFDKSIVDEITGSGIKSSEEFISILNRYKRDDGTLKSETNKYSISEIERKVKELSLPAISLYYLSDVYRNKNDMQLKEKIGYAITEYAEKRTGTAIKLTAEERNIIAEQYILEQGMAEYESAVASTTSELLSKIQYELSRTDYNSNESDFSRITQKYIAEILTGRKFNVNAPFNEKYLSTAPQWKFSAGKDENFEARNKAIMNFISAGGGSLENTDRVKDIHSADEAIFDKAKSKLSYLLNNTTPSSGATGNNPYYEIPDLLKLSSTIDEIDRYRKNLIKNINGSENTDLISKLKSNNTGIAARGINRIETQYKNEEARIERLKKIKGDITIYNEEIFNASKIHFYSIRDELYRYADLSADFISVIYSSGKTDPKKYIELHKYRSDRFIQYISFSEKLTADIITLSKSGSGQLLSFYKSTIPGVLAADKDLLKPTAIPSEIRETLSKELLKEYADINADFRTRGSALVIGIRKNYDESMAGFSRSAALEKESLIYSEAQIGQDETDRLFRFSKKCSDTLSEMKYTESALNEYKNEYNRISEELKKGNKPSGYSGTDTPAAFYSTIKNFNPEAIEREYSTRDLIAKEGMETLSGSITLVQYYKRKGIPVKFTPSNEEIILMKQVFSKSPEVTVSSWKMNGKNFRQVDINITAELKKLFNKNAWNNSGKSPEEILTIDDTGMSIVFSPPSGWKKNINSDTDHISQISFESPDKKGSIEITSIREDEHNLQVLAGSWPEKSGFSMTGKTWGKKDNSDYIRSTAKNRYDGIMESYMIAKKGYIIILTGKTSENNFRLLNRTLGELFRKLEVKG